MKRVLFILTALIISVNLIFSQSNGKVVYGPNAESSNRKSSIIVDQADGNTIAYSESTKTGSGYDPKPILRGGDYAPLGSQFTAYVSSSTDTSFRVTVVDAADCAGTYTVSCTPIAGSGPGGSDPPFTSITAYIGFPQGNFLFNNAGNGEYLITVLNTNGSCSPPINPVYFHAWPTSYTPIFVPVIARDTNVFPPSVPFKGQGYTADGHFTVKVYDTLTCSGTYTIYVSPVPNSAPDGTTPPTTFIVGYIGFPAGSFLFDGAGTGRYRVTVTQTDWNTICNYTDNPLVFYVDIPDIREIPVSNWALALGIGLIVLLAVIRFRRIL